MIEYRYLLAAVLTSPGDDLPRLVLADWWDENGQSERAAFCRVQCGECSCTYSHHNRSSTCARCYREAELWDANWKTWTPEEFWGLATDIRGCTFRRGFISEIRCTLAHWCGASCRDCDGRGFLYGDYGHASSTEEGPCPTCDGTGRTPAHGPRIVRGHPVERVVLTDREPKIMTGRDWFSWGNMRGTSAEPQQLLPEAIWRKLEEQNHPGRNHWNVGFHTREAALDALSTACIAWAKAQPVAI